MQYFKVHCPLNPQALRHETGMYCRVGCRCDRHWLDVSGHCRLSDHAKLGPHPSGTFLYSVVLDSQGNSTGEPFAIFAQNGLYIYLLAGS